MSFSLSVAKLEDNGTPFSHPLSSLAGWLWDNWTGGHPALLPCTATLVPAVVHSADSSRSSGSPQRLPRSPLVLPGNAPSPIPSGPASYGLAAHWSCDDLLMTKSIFLYNSVLLSLWKKNLLSSLMQLHKLKTKNANMALLPTGPVMIFF